MIAEYNLPLGPQTLNHFLSSPTWMFSWHPTLLSKWPEKQTLDFPPQASSHVTIPKRPPALVRNAGSTLGSPSSHSPRASTAVLMAFLSKRI